MFWRNKKIKSDEYEDLAKRIGTLRADIEDLKARSEKFEARLTIAKRREKTDTQEMDELERQKKEIEEYLRANGFS